MSEEKAVICAHIACSCSKTPHSVDWNHENGWIIFGSSRNVGLISPETTEKAAVIAGTFCEHEGDVVCVKWISNAESGNPASGSFALSGSTDSRAILWQFDETGILLCKITCCVGHSMSINHVCGLQVDSSVIICTSSADSTIKIWTADAAAKGEGTTDARQTINVERSGFALCADMRTWNGGIILAAGCDDKKIHLFWQRAMDQAFTPVMKLSGHEDWIRGISFQPVTDILSHTSSSSAASSLLLASCSQDSYVRIWCLSTLLDGSSGDGDINSENVNGSGIRLKRQTFSIEKIKGENVTCSAGLEAVLAGHEDWVYSVRWHPRGKSRLLTASMDKCLVLWEPDQASGVWLEKTRLGVVGGPVASGFYGGIFGPDGSSVLGHTFQGGFHIWKEKVAEWKPAIAPSGHFGPVEDVCWDVNGHYLLSCGADQTTRLYAPWIRDQAAVTVHEISRPQVHGYDMQCLASISSSCFVSGAEEKILRAFVSTKNFAENFLRITNASGSRAEESLSVLCDLSAVTAEGACVPSLGLSNKAVFSGETAPKANGSTVMGVQDDEEGGDAGDMDAAMAFHPAMLSAPPTEDCLMQNTLWPEVHKLYGHGCEVFAIDCNRAGTVIASAAKANKAEQAQVILWSTKDWQQRGQIGGHSLTVTQIAFSPDDSYLLTVSRDRTWCLYRKGDDDFEWTRVGFTDKKTAVHGRIIWSCAWSPDSKYFVTTSRDKKVVVWKPTNQSTGTSTGIVHQVGTVLEAPASVTAVSISSQQMSADSYLMALGLESGEILFYEWNALKLVFEKRLELDRNMAHGSTVKRLRFRPRAKEDWLHPSSNYSSNDIAYLASCSDDHSVKVFRLNLRKLAP